jgi:hypothetical protein
MPVVSSGAGWIRCADALRILLAYGSSTWRAAVVGVAVLALTPMAASAQSLPRLHITALGLHADQRVVHPGQSFHVTVHVHVKEKPPRLDELVLPALNNAVDLGDERKRVPAADGTDFYETLTVAANTVGMASFSPAYIDAIDPGSGRGMRYSSQSLNVRVTPASGAPVPESDPVADFFRKSMPAMVRGATFLAVAIVAVIAAAIFAVARSRRSRVANVAASERPKPVRKVVPPADQLRDASAAYRARGDDASLDALRNVLFTRAGAAPGATFSDALRALGARDPHLARLMAVAERARFGPVHERAAAARDLLALLDTYAPEGVPAA